MYDISDSKMLDDIRCLSWNTAIIVFMKKCHMDRRLYEMFIGTPCTKELQVFPSKKVACTIYNGTEKQLGRKLRAASVQVNIFF